MGALAETALVTQYLYAPIFGELCFARWNQGEVDLVRLDQVRPSVLWALEVKWSDRACDSAEAWSSLADFARGNGVHTTHMTSRTVGPSRGARGTARRRAPIAAALLPDWHLARPPKAGAGSLGSAGR